MKTLIYVLHNGRQRFGWYKGATILDQMASTASTHLTDNTPETEDVFSSAANTGLADNFTGEVLAHGVSLEPKRNGAILYRSKYPHRPKALRNGANKYKDHLPRFLGPRRDGRYKYGDTLQEKLENYSTSILMQDTPVTQPPKRNGSFFYRDKGIYHGLCHAPVESVYFAFGLQETDSIDFEDLSAGQVNMSASDVYPGRAPVHSAPEQFLHNAYIKHKYAGSYSWRGNHYNEQRYHGKSPVDRLDTATANLSLGDIATGYHLYGKDRLHHDGSGLRWKHYGMLLRRPFARHDSIWSRGGDKRYLEAQVRYNDLALIHDGIDLYGVSNGTHNGNILRRPTVVPEEMNLIIHKGYRRIAA
jgi:hypothetical protein